MVSELLMSCYNFCTSTPKGSYVYRIGHIFPFFDPEGVACDNFKYIRPLQGRDFRVRKFYKHLTPSGSLE